MVVLVAPVTIGKPLTTLLVLYLFILNTTFWSENGEAVRSLGMKLMLILLLFPALLLTIFDSPREDLARFLPIILLITLFPYKNIKPDNKTLNYIALLILIYLTLTQLLMATGNSFALNLRDSLYEYTDSQAIFDEGTIETLNLSKFGVYRSGGIFYNPNVLGSNLLMYFLIFHITSKTHVSEGYRDNIRKLRVYTTLFIITTLSLFITGSRTATGSFFVFLFLDSYFKPIRDLIMKGKINLKNLPVILLISVSFTFTLFRSIERFSQGITNKEGSLNIKNQILIKYIKETFKEDPFNLMVGGNYSIAFDADWGHLIGGFGILGTLAIISYYIVLTRNNQTTFPAVVALILAGFGNSIIFNLATSLQVLILMIIYANNKYKLRLDYRESLVNKYAPSFYNRSFDFSSSKEK